MPGTRALALAMVAAAAAAAPADSGDVGAEDAFSAAGTRYHSRLLPPGLTDLRLGGLADILLSSAGGSLAADHGVAELGPGALSLGVELGASKCLFACRRVSPDLVVDRLTFAPALRIAYHLPIESSAPNLTATGFYALLMGGAAISVVDEQDATARVRATTYSPLVSVGLGTAYFPGRGDEVFAGGEARLTYMPRFSALSVSPPQALLQPQSVAPLGGLSLLFFMGIRL